VPLTFSRRRFQLQVENLKNPRLTSKSSSYSATNSLYKLLALSIKPCEYFGLTIFSLEAKAKLKFRVCSSPFILFVLRYVSLTLGVIIFCKYSFILESVYDSSRMSKTEKSTQIITSISAVSADLVHTAFVLINRLKVISFHDSLEIFVGIANDAMSEKEQKYLNSMKKYKWLISIAFYYVSVTSCIVFIFTILNSTDDLGVDAYLMPVFLVTASGSTYFGLIRLLWPIAIFHVLKTCALSINTRLGKLASTQETEKVHCQQVKMILFHIKTLELLVADVNSVFGWWISMNVVLMLGSITTSLFSSIIFMLNVGVGAGLSFALPFVILASILFELCNSAFGFEREACFEC